MDFPNGNNQTMITYSSIDNTEIRDFSGVLLYSNYMINEAGGCHIVT